MIPLGLGHPWVVASESVADRHTVVSEIRCGRDQRTESGFARGHAAAAHRLREENTLQKQGTLAGKIVLKP